MGGDAEVGMPQPQPVDNAAPAQPISKLFFPEDAGGVQKLVSTSLFVRVAQSVLGWIVLGLSASALSDVNDAKQAFDDAKQAFESAPTFVINFDLLFPESSLAWMVVNGLFLALGSLVLGGMAFQLNNGSGNPLLFSRGSIAFDVVFSYMLFSAFSVGASIGLGAASAFLFISWMVCLGSIAVSVAIYLNHGILAP